MISATIITLNEQEQIDDCMKSLKDLTDEIVVVDSGSTDRTVEIAKGYGAQVFKRKLDNFANQKNYASSKVKDEWVLSIDADEVITPQLAEEIKQAISDDKYEGFLIPRRNFILGGEIKHSRWSPDKHIWLWKKDLGNWVGGVHEEVIVNGRVGNLKNAKLHYSHRTVKEFFAANNKYSTLEAEKAVIEKIKFSFWHLVYDPLFEFLLRYIYKQGFLDGYRGFILCYLMGVYKLIVWVKVWEMEHRKI